MSLSKSTNQEHAQAIVQCDICKNDKDAENDYHVECKQIICTEHGDLIVTLRCEKCKVLVCTRCAEDKHCGHPMNEISESFEKEKKKMELEIAKMEDETLPALKVSVNGLRSKRQQYMKDIDKLRQEMEDEVRSYKVQVDLVHKKRMEKLSLMEREDLSASEDHEKEQEAQIAECTQIISEQKDIVRRTCQSAFLLFIDQRTPPTQIGLSHLVITPPNLHPASFPDVNAHLGKIARASSIIPHSIEKKRIRPEKISSFQSELKGWPSICMTKEDLAWIGGSDDKTLKLMDKNGKVVDQKRVHNRPFALAMLTSDEIIIRPTTEDSKSVIKLRTDGTAQVIFNAYPYNCTGVSVTRDQDILICTEEGRVVRCDSDGNNKKVVYKGSGANTAFHAVESNDGNIYISDYLNGKLMVINKEGKEMTTITQPLRRENFVPMGLACDTKGNILSADHANNSVYIIERSGEMRELVGLSFGIQHPRWLAVDHDDNLWITNDEDGTITVVKYLE